jgi:serine/threonine protein kinase
MTDRYSIIEELAGSGGFGRVAKAFDRDLDRQVAIKILDPLFKEKPGNEDKERFRREARTLASLSYPTVPAIYDIRIDEASHDFRIVFEWIEGTTVRQWLLDRGPISLDDAKRWFANICGALSHAHAKGIIHRDIKPSNLIVTPDGSACYLVDFGIALRKTDLDRLTGGSPVGTAGYMSPEQERGEPTDATADMYSLGIVLYECLSGIRPSVGGYRSLTTFNEAIPPGIDDLVRQCLGDRSTRPPSATAFLTSLNHALTPHANFTDTLSKGTLYEIALAIGAMSPVDFARLKRGQRVLIISRLRDLISVDEENLRRATAQLLAGLTRAGHLQPDADFEFIIEKSLVFGYEMKYGEKWVGNDRIREALNDVAIECTGPTHRVLSEQVIAFLNTLPDLERKPKWYFHELRILLQYLLANPNCGEDHAEPLGEQLTKINTLSHKSALE